MLEKEDNVCDVRCFDQMVSDQKAARVGRKEVEKVLIVLEGMSRRLLMARDRLLDDLFRSKL